MGMLATEVMGATRAVAAADDFNTRYPPAAKLPFETVMTSVRFKSPPNVTPAVLLMVRPFTALPVKAAAGMVCAASPFISMVPLAAIKLLLLLMPPPIFKCRLSIFKVPKLTVTLLLTANTGVCKMAVALVLLTVKL